MQEPVIDVAKSIGDRALLPVQSSELKLGEPLAWQLFDPNGQLLAKEGTVLYWEVQVQRLLARGCCRAVSAQEGAREAGGAPPRQAHTSLDVIEALEDIVQQMSRSHARLASNDTEHLVEDILRMGALIQDICTEDADAALAWLHLHASVPYPVLHALHAAIAGELVARYAGLAEIERLSLCCAALTHDFGLLSQQAAIDANKGPLSDLEKQQIRAHPERGVALLRSIGVQDQVWLDSVFCHHERSDGSGYPRGLDKDSIPLTARILSDLAPISRTLG